MSRPSTPSSASTVYSRRKASRHWELDQAKSQRKGQTILSMESTGARLMRLAAYTLRGERFQDLDESLARVDAVTLDEVNAACAHYFGPEDQYVLSLGPEGSLP